MVNSQIQELEDRAKGLESELQRRQQLLVKLEEDLAAAAAAAAGVAAPPGRAAAALAPSKSASHGLLSPLAADPGAAAPPAEGEALGAILGGAVAETAGSGALEGGAAAEQQNGGSGGGGGGGGGADGGGGLLEIVVSQRDRFRQRMLQLEEEKGEGCGGRVQGRGETGHALLPWSLCKHGSLRKHAFSDGCPSTSLGRGQALSHRKRLAVNTVCTHALPARPLHRCCTFLAPLQASWVRSCARRSSNCRRRAMTT